MPSLCQWQCVTWESTLDAVSHSADCHSLHVALPPCVNSAIPTFSFNVCFPDSGCHACAVGDRLWQCYIGCPPVWLVEPRCWHALSESTIVVPAKLLCVRHVVSQLANVHLILLAQSCGIVFQMKLHLHHQVIIGHTERQSKPKLYTTPLCRWWNITQMGRYLLLQYTADLLTKLLRRSGPQDPHMSDAYGDWYLFCSIAQYQQETISMFCEHMHKCCTCADQYTPASAGFLSLNGPTRATRQHNAAREECAWPWHLLINDNKR